MPPAASSGIQVPPSWALVVTGAWLHWRAAVQTSAADTRRANLLGLVVLVAGLIILAVDALIA